MTGLCTLSVRLLVKGQDQPVRVRPHFVIRLVVVAYRSVNAYGEKTSRSDRVPWDREPWIAVGLCGRSGRPGEG